MRESRIGNILKVLVLAAGAFGMITACVGGSGDTDAGKAKNDLGEGSQFVADGGAGASIRIRAPRDLSVGETGGFRVYLEDPNGDPLAFVRVNCESEKGIAILEPSSGGVAFEHTSENGDLSGRLGGLVPGSYIIECRAPEGFGLVARATVIVRGPVPEGFLGFPGAAGGNLGGGLLIDLTPDVTESDLGQDNGAVRVEAINFSDGPNANGPNGPIDIVQSTCTNNTTDPSDDYPEPFYFNEYILSISNKTTQNIFVDSVDMTIRDAGPTSIATQFFFTDHSKQVEIAAGASGNVSGLFTEFQLGAAKLYVGTTDAVAAGTYRVDFVVTGVTDDETVFTLAASATLTFDAVNRCDD